MKLTAVAVLKWNGEQEPLLFGLAADLSTFGFFQRGSVREMLTFVSRTVAKRTQPGTRQTVQHEEYYCHAHNRDGLVRQPTPCHPPIALSWQPGARHGSRSCSALPRAELWGQRT
jgi:hypothetical protein